MTTRKNQPVELGDLPFEHWHVLGPVLWGVVAYMAAGILHLLGDAVPALYVTLVGLAVSLLAPLTAVYKRFTFLLMLATTGLLTWTTATTPWARWPILSTLAGSILFGLGYQVLRTREDKAEDADKLVQKAASKGRYVELLESVGLKGMKEHSRADFPAGKTIKLLLPATGKVDLFKLKGSITALEIAAARAGLHVRFDFEQDPGSAALVDMHVFERDVLAEEIPLEPDRGPKSIRDPLPLGKYATGEVCVVTFREVAALMVGLKGKGKSGLINTHLAYLTGCTDAVVWMMDGKGGETVRPWLQPFLDMVTDRPAINWAAADDAEYDAMLLAANFVREFRTSKDWRVPVSGFPSAAAPSVIVIVEEASVITGLGRYGNGVQRQKLAQDGVTLGRSSCVDWVFATQRAVLDMLGTGAMKSNLDLRYGMGIEEEADARMVFPDGAMAKAMYRLGRERKYRGTFLMRAPDEARVMPVKGFWTHPDTIPGLAQTNAQWTAELDKPTADYVHAKLVAIGVPGGYYGRWDRYMGRVPASQSAVSSQPVPPSQPAASRPTETTGTPGQYDGSRGRDAVRDAIAASRAKREAETFEQLWSANFETVQVGDETHLRDVSAAPENAPAILRCMLAVFKGRGNPESLPSKVLCEELPGDLNPTALGRLMALCSVSPGEVIWEGKRARGYTRDALETSIKRGSWTLGATDWKP